MQRAIPWNKRMSELARGVGKPHTPLFAPLARACASQIEAIPPSAMLMDPTRLVRGLTELRRALDLNILVTAAASCMEAEALGAEVDWNTWPPRISARPSADVFSQEAVLGWGRSPMLGAAIETTRRLASGIGEDTVIVAALTGPASLLRQLVGADAAPTEAALEMIGRSLAALLRAFGEAGAGLIILVEEAPEVADATTWRAALGTIGNVARFHRLPLMLVFADPVAWPDALPAHLVPCPPGEHQPAVASRLHGLALPVDPNLWAPVTFAPTTRVITTAGEAPADANIAALRARVRLMETHDAKAS